MMEEMQEGEVIRALTVVTVCLDAIVSLVSSLTHVLES